MTLISNRGYKILETPRLLLAGMIVAIWISFVGSTLGQDDYWGRGAGTSVRSRGDQWYIEQTRKFEKGVLRLPDANKLSRVEIHWTEVIIDDLGNFCTIVGRVLIKNDAGQLEPIDWQQSISVHLNKEPLATPDWSGGVNSETVSSDFVQVSRDGTFRATFDLRECDKKFGRLRDLQAGVSLAQQTSDDLQTLVIRIQSTVPVLVHSIKMLTVPESKELPEIIRLIDHANSWPDSDSNAVDLIRAANELRKLSRDEAIQAMEDYLHMVGATAAAFDFEESYVLYGIIQCAFEPANPNDQLPPPKYFRSLYDWRRSFPFGPWHRDPMEIHEDIPWLLGKPVALGGVPWDPKTDLVWLRRHGVLRDSPLRPADNPLESAERLMKEPRWAMLPEDTRTIASSQLKEQAWAMVGDLLPVIPKNALDRYDVDTNWEELLRTSKKIGLFWDETAQAYALPTQGGLPQPLR